MNQTQKARSGLVIGSMLVVAGAVLLVNRMGLLEWQRPVSLWPIVLMGIGLTRLLQTPSGAPYRGLLLLSGGVWLMSVEAGWLSLVNSWPVLIVALGAAIALNGVTGRAGRTEPQPADDDVPSETRERRRTFRGQRRRALPPLAIAGIWIVIITALQTPLTGSHQDQSGGRTPHVLAILGQPGRTVRTGDFRGMEMLSVMGRSELDLTAVTLPPSQEEITIDVVALMGRAVVRVPREWQVELDALPLGGQITDERPAAAVGAAPSTSLPRVRIKAVAAMGSLAVRY